jgi:hypothetical protein
MEETLRVSFYEDRPAMLKIKVNGAEAMLHARERDESEWLLRCVDPLVGEFHLLSTDGLELWWPEAGQWLPTTEGDLLELAVAECEYESNKNH